MNVPAQSRTDSKERAMLGASLRGSDILVTGGAGFIGSHLADRLVELGSRVTILDNLSNGRQLNLNPRADFVDCNLLDYQRVKENVSHRQVVFHLAGSATTRESSMGWKDPVYDYRSNTICTVNLLMAIAELRRRPKFVYASSAAVYGIPQYLPVDEAHPTEPISPYGVSKLASEKYCFAYCHQRGLDVTILRLFSPYGPRQRRYVIFDLLSKLLEHPKRLDVLGDGRQVRDYCYVSEVVQAFILAAETGPCGEALNVAGGKGVTIAELVNMLIKITGLEGKVDVHYSGRSWQGDIPEIAADISKIEALGFKPSIGLEEGTRRLKDWLAETLHEGL